MICSDDIPSDFSKKTTTGATNGARTAYGDRALTWDHPCCSGVPVVQSLLFANALWVIVCILLFLLTIVLSVLQYTASNYPLRLFKII